MGITNVRLQIELWHEEKSIRKTIVTVGLVGVKAIVASGDFIAAMLYNTSKPNSYKISITIRCLFQFGEGGVFLLELYISGVC